MIKLCGVECAAINSLSFILHSHYNLKTINSYSDFISFTRDMYSINYASPVTVTAIFITREPLLKYKLLFLFQIITFFMFNISKYVLTVACV